jgi:hypothetical protein
VEIADGLGYAQAIHGQRFNPMLPLKALVFFRDGDLAGLPEEVKRRLADAVQGVGSIPAVHPYSERIGSGGMG